MRLFSTIFLVFLVYSDFISAQKTTPPSELQRTAEIKSIINEAYLLPDEIGADLILKILQANLVKENEKKKELLERVLIQSNSAQFPIKKSLAVNGISVDTREVFLSQSYNLNIDKMSLQLRVVNEMLEIDKFRARQIFNEISIDKKLTASTCVDALIADVSDYYKTLTKIANTGFSVKEKKDFLHYNFVETRVRNISSNIQVNPVLKMLLSLNFKLREKEDLTVLFLTSLRTIEPDFRSFSAVLTKSSVINDLFAINKSLASPQNQALLSISFRNFLINNLEIPRCADYGIREEEIPRFISFFNKTFVSNSPIILEEIKQKQIESNLILNDVATNQDYIKLKKKYRELRFSETEDTDGNNFREISEEEKNDIVWDNKVAEFLSELENWDGISEESEIDFLYKKSIFYTVLLEILPEDKSLKPKVESSFANFITKSNTHKTNRVSWFYWALEIMNNKNFSTRQNFTHPVFLAYNKFYSIKSVSQ